MKPKKIITMASEDATTILMYLESCEDNANTDDVNALIAASHYIVQRAWLGYELDNYEKVISEANAVIAKYEVEAPKQRYRIPENSITA